MLKSIAGLFSTKPSEYTDYHSSEHDSTNANVEPHLPSTISGPGRQPDDVHSRPTTADALHESLITAHGQGRDKRKRSKERRKDMEGVVGNYTSEGDAAATSWPSQDSDWIPRRKQSRMPNPHRRSVHQPRNTLSEARFGQHFALSDRRGPAHTGQLKGPGFASIRDASSRKIQRSGTTQAKEAIVASEHVAKRRKLSLDSMAGSKHALKSKVLPNSSPRQPIDLTSDDNELEVRHNEPAFDTYLQHNSKPSHSPDAVGSTLSRSKYFDHPELRATNQWTGTSRAKRSRRNESARNSQLTLVMSDQLRSQQMGVQSPNDSVSVVSQSPKESLRDLSGNSSPNRVAHSSVMIKQAPTIDLMKDMPLTDDQLTPEYHTERGTQQSSKQFRFAFEAKEQSSNPVGNKQRPSKADIREYYTSNVDEKAAEVRAADAFQRLPQPGQVKRLKRKDRMMSLSKLPHSNRAQIRQNAESDDDVATAPKTVGTRVEIGQPVIRPNSRIDDTSNSRSIRSLSQVCRSVKTSGRASGSPPNDSHLPDIKHLSAREQKPAEQEVRIPIRAIYSQGCCISEARSLEARSLNLVWLLRKRVFVVVCNDELKRLNKDEVFELDAAAVFHNWQQCLKTLRVLLKGGKTQFCNGTTLLQFWNYEDLLNCRKYLLEASRTQPAITNVNHDIMARKFPRQRHELKEAYERQQALVADRSLNKSRQLPATKFGLHLHEAAHDEQIRYDFNPDDAGIMSSSRVSDTRTEISPQTHHETGISSSDGKAMAFFGPRRSNRTLQTFAHEAPSPPSPEKWTRRHKPTPWAHPVLFPATGPRQTEVSFRDLERLDDGEFLNDNIVHYGLRRIEEAMPPQHKRDVHFFNSFFYSALSNKNGRKAFNYDAVKRWTRNIDIFAVPYVVVPINAELHWFVAIICNLPELERRISGPNDDQLEDAQPERPPKSNGVTDDVQNKIDALYSLGERVGQPTEQAAASGFGQSLFSAKLLDGSSDSVWDGTIVDDRDRQNADTRFSSASGSGRKVRKKPVGRRLSPHEPAIITLDSLGNTRSPEIRYLKEYIQAEAKDKRAMDVEIGQLLGVTAKHIPMQANFSDCGVYLIGYLEEFAKDPRSFVSKVLSRSELEADFSSFDPSKKRAKLRDSLLELNEQQEASRSALKAAKRTKRLEQQSTDQTQTKFQNEVMPQGLPWKSTLDDTLSSAAPSSLRAHDKVQVQDERDLEVSTQPTNPNGPPAADITIEDPTPPKTSSHVEISTVHSPHSPNAFSNTKLGPFPPQPSTKRHREGVTGRTSQSSEDTENFAKRSRWQLSPTKTKANALPVDRSPSARRPIQITDSDISPNANSDGTSTLLSFDEDLGEKHERTYEHPRVVVKRGEKAKIRVEDDTGSEIPDSQDAQIQTRTNEDSLEF